MVRLSKPYRVTFLYFEGNDSLNFPILGVRARLTNVFGGENLKIGEGAVIRTAIIGDNVTIGAGSSIGNNSIIGNNVTIPPKTVVNKHSVILTTTFEDHPDIKTTRKNGN